MTHVPEDEYIAAIASDLKDVYGANRVRTEVVLPVTERRLDIFVETPSGADDLAIEVENGFESAAQGIGQAIQYAEQKNARAVVFVPPGHIEIPEVFYLSARGVDIYQYPTPDE